ncbi:hypothetical protein [Desulforhopalus singaporensis]|uniref:Integron cassette protein domain-containing protein n=1 Tax=Desulforhopalus singaporensis TaxID=91360 RepID=A0A1H0VI21_9BACT|nr:hypothetical protein [Desulforhopalus singaporensis]SDP78202.1 hypothetical protein SAMN05660330_04092 [Desulforhopalus singaporensis]
MDKITPLKDTVSTLVSEIKELLLSAEWNINKPEHAEKWETMVAKAIELHHLVNPKHHDYMIKNRGCSPEEPEFYNHIHPIEDLLAFIDDPSANDDPEDITIDQEFTFTVFSRRWGHTDTYKMKRIATGWHFSHASVHMSGNCDKDGTPFLYENLNHDSINYPEELPGYFEWLWDQAAERGLTNKEVQDNLDALGEWVSLCEKNSPKGIWESFK